MNDVSKENEFVDYIHFFLRRKWLILFITMGLTLVAGIISLYQTKIYQSSALLQLGVIAERSTGPGGEKMLPIPIEDTKTVSELLATDSMALNLKNTLNFDTDTSLRSIQNTITIRIIKNEILNTPTALLAISFKHTDPQKTVDGLNFLMGQIINEHQKKYNAGISRFDNQLSLVVEKIDNSTTQQEKIKEKIQKINEQIVIDEGYKRIINKQIEVLEKDLKSNRKTLADIDIKNITPLEILFIQNNLQLQETQFSEFQRELNSIELGNKDRKKQISDMESQIAALQNHIEDLHETQIQINALKNFSNNTFIRSGAVIPTQHISPNKTNNVMAGAGIGLLLSLMIAFTLEYSKKRSV